MAREEIEALRQRMGRSIGTQPEVIGRPIIGLIANGELLVDGLPRLARTCAIRAMAKNTEAAFSRVRLIPDLLRTPETSAETARIPALYPVWRAKIVAPRSPAGIYGGTNPETTSNGSSRSL